MNSDNKKLHQGFKWSRKYQYIDILMSGEFKRVLKCVTFVTAIALGLLIVAGLVHSFVVGSPSSEFQSTQEKMTWMPWDVFVQLTNPAVKVGADWFDIIMMLLTNIAGIIFINGLLLTCLVNWVFARRERFAKGESRYENIKNTKYAVIIGGHKMVAGLARDLIGKYEYVLIQTQRNPEKLRQEISAEIVDAAQVRDVVIYSGDRTSWHNLSDLNIDSAQEIYIIGEPFILDGTSHDAINMQCWELINEHLNEDRESKIPCHIMFEYQSTFAAFQFTDLKIEYSKTFKFIPFSLYENWAQQVLLGDNLNGQSCYLPLDGSNGLPYSSHQRAHLIVVGMSNMGMALAIEAAHVAHYPNFNNPHAGRPRTLITFIDRNAKREMLFFMGRFKELFKLVRWRFVKAPDEIVYDGTPLWDIYDTSERINKKANEKYPWNDPLNDEKFGSPYYGGYLGEDFIDMDFEFIEGDVALPSIQKYISDACADNTAKIVNYNTQNSTSIPDNTSKTTIAICFPVAVEAMSAALYFDTSVYKNVQQIWVQQSESGALVDAVRFGLTGLDNAKFSVLRPFGMLDKCDYLTRINNLLPKLVAYAYHCLEKGTSLTNEYKTKNNKEFIDSVYTNWLGITQDGGKSAISKRWSNIYCANSFSTKIRAVGIDLSTNDDLCDSTMIDHLAKVEHNRWVMEQLLLGMKPVDRSYKDKLPIENKNERTELKGRNIHPDLISNEKLGSTQAYDIGISKIIPVAIDIANHYAAND